MAESKLPKSGTDGLVAAMQLLLSSCTNAQKETIIREAFGHVLFVRDRTEARMKDALNLISFIDTDTKAILEITKDGTGIGTLMVKKITIEAEAIVRYCDRLRDEFKP